MSEQKRENFRIEYPASYRPSFTTGGVAHEVIDLSEKGLKFTLSDNFRPKIGATIRGKLTFKDGKVVDVVGEVLRILEDQGYCVVKMKQGVSLAKMMEEQRTIIQKFKP